MFTSTHRRGRKGIAVAEWIYNLVLEDKRFDTELLDLTKINLPFSETSTVQASNGVRRSILTAMET